MFRETIYWIYSFSLLGLMVIANDEQMKENHKQSLDASLKGLTKSKGKRNKKMWEVFVKLSVNSVIALKSDKHTEELANKILATHLDSKDNDVSASLLKLSMACFGSGLNQKSRDIVDLLITLNENYAEGWFFSGWLLLDSNLKLAKQRLTKSTELDPNLSERIQADERCVAYLDQLPKA